MERRGTLAPIFLALASAGFVGRALAQDPNDPGLPGPPVARGPISVAPAPASPAPSTSTAPTPTGARSPAPSTTPAPGFTSLSTVKSTKGHFRVRGRHARLGFYGGTIDVYPAGPGYRYDRLTRYDVNATPELERGTVVFSGKTFTAEEDPDDATRGFVTMGTGARKTRRKTVYTQFARDKYEGTFTVTGGQTPDTGTEQLDKDGAEDAFKLLIDGGEVFPSFREEMKRATASISVETFILKDDDTGRSIMEILEDKARRGVEVRILCDSIGTGGDGEKLLERVKKAGGQYILSNKWYQGLGHSLADLGKSIWNGIKSLFGGSAPKPEPKHGIFNHDHRKVVVVDGRVGFAGGMNMAHEYEHEWHDIQCRVEGPVAHQLQDRFLEMWKMYGGQAPKDRWKVYFDHASAPPAGDSKCDVIANTPGVKMEITDTYLAEIRKARKKVLIENAYFLNDDVIGSLQQKVREGVPAVVIVPADPVNDLPVVRDAFMWVENDVIRSGVELRKYPGRMTHTKVATIDGVWSTVGSCNLDDVALRRLYELNVHSYDPRIAKVLEQRVFETDIPKTERCVEKKLSFWQKIKSGTLHFFRSFI